MSEDQEIDPLARIGSVDFDDWWKGQGLDGGSARLMSSGQESDLGQSRYESLVLVTGF